MTKEFFHSLTGELFFTPFFYKKQWLVLFLSALILWLLFDYTSLDMWLSTPYYDFKNQIWPYKYSKIVLFIYHNSKTLIYFYSGTLFILFLLSFWQTLLAPYRRTFLFLILCIAVIPLEIGILKAVFFKSRPDQVFEFGGTMPHVDLFHFLWNEHDATNWPGGHASGGAALLSLYFPLRQRSAKWGYFAIAFALFYWFVMSWTQVMRGQHFMSHNLWTLWFAWLTILLIHQKIFRSRLFPRNP